MKKKRKITPNQLLMRVRRDIVSVKREFEFNVWDEYTVQRCKKDLANAYNLLTVLLSHQGIKVKIVKVPHHKDPCHAWHYFHQWYKVGDIITVVSFKSQTGTTVYLDIAPERANRAALLMSEFRHEHLRRIRNG